MISVTEASSLINQHLWSPAEAMIPIADAFGRVLARDVLADRDLPPYHRVAMDGIAIRQADVLSGTTRFTVTGIAPAGEPAKSLEGDHTCMEVMTGAVLPFGADAVVKVEDVEIIDGQATLKIKSIDPGMNIHSCGSDLKSGEILLRKGTLLSVAEIPMLASVGISLVPVLAAPRTALITTGDELVEIAQTPLPHQIRRSNMIAVEAALKPFGAECSLHHFGDREYLNEPAVGKRKFNDILHDADLIILSGGVSKGKFDWVPDALEAAGIRCVFHTVAQRPGKPLWFGTGNGKTVFALPGNPVSVFLCLHRYVLPWLRSSMGIRRRPLTAELGMDFHSTVPLTHFVQVRIDEADPRLVIPVPGGGSGDFVNLRQADGFLELPPRAGLLEKGMVFPYLPFRG